MRYAVKERCKVFTPLVNYRVSSLENFKGEKEKGKLANGLEYSSERRLKKGT